MKKILLSLAATTFLFGSGDSQAIVSEVTKLRKKYEECKAKEMRIGDLKAGRETSQRLDVLSRELSQKEAMIRSLEKTLASRDRAYREMAARNKSLVQQIRTDKVSRQERESLKRAVIAAKAELALAQKELRGGSKSVGELRQELRQAKATIVSLQAAQKNVSHPIVAKPTPLQPDKRIQTLQAELTSANATITALRTELSESRKHPNVITKVIEPTEKLKALQTQLSQAQTTIANLRGNSGVKTVVKEKVVEKVVYKDRPVEKVVEKVVYKDRPSSEPKVVTKVVEKVVYKDRPVEKIVEKVVYKDRPIVKEKVVEKVVYQDRPSKTRDEAAQRRIDKLALELERAKSSSKTSTPVVKPVSATKSTEPAPKKSSGSSSAYRMAVNAPIYSAPYGRQVDTWEARRSFTAGSPSNGWVHITGYFVNRVWQPTQEGENLYVKESDVIRR